MSDPAIVLLDLDTNETYVVEVGTPAHYAALDWARFHGLDPLRIPRGGYVERDGALRRITYERFEAEDIRTAPREEVLDEDGNVRTIDVVEQGEAPPLPFPPEVTGGT